MRKSCQECESTRIASVSAKCSDMCSIRVGARESEGYVPSDLGIGHGDYVQLTWCLDCGQIQGTWPRPESELEQSESEVGT